VKGNGLRNTRWHGGRDRMKKRPLRVDATKFFMENDDWSCGASIAYFTLSSVAPSLLVVSPGAFPPPHALAGHLKGKPAIQKGKARRSRDLQRRLR
jgi:hypothetical protein